MIQRLSVPLSSALHVGALGLFLLASCLAVGTIQAPIDVDPLRIFIPHAPLVVAPPPKGSAAAAVTERRKDPPKAKLPEMIQPQVVPELPQPPAVDAIESEDRGVEAGENGGVQGGTPGGTPGGDVNGVLDGSLLGSRDGIPGGIEPAPPPDDPPARLTGDIRPPSLVRRVDPAYPELARISRMEGRVVLEIVVGRDGNVEAVTVLKSSAVFDEAAMVAVRKWRYEPALQNGRAVKVFVTVVVDFKLR
ncbi:MAG: energy transducer TonB [Acidobacteria bacterium]|nr:energy transducer TonB [Acidobacteriota bacterium]